MDTVRDFTKGSIAKAILAFYFPMLVTNMLQQVYTFADTAIVGNGLGDTALAAVGNMGSPNFLVIGFSIGLSVGFTVVIAQCFGAKRFDDLRHSLAAALVIAISIVIILTVLSNIFLEKALYALRADPLIIDDSLRYGHILFAGLFATIGYNLSAAVLRALGDSKTPLRAIIISSIVNIVLDYFLIFIVGTGVEGAAGATVFSQVISATICIRKITQIKEAKISRADFKNSVSVYIELLKNGIPMGIMNSITAIGCMVVQFFVNGYGVLFTAAYSACVKYINLFMNPAYTAGHAVSAFVGQNYGAKEFGRIKKGIIVCLLIATTSYILLGAVMLIYARPLADIFLTSEEAINLTVSFLHITGVTIVAVDFLFVFRSAVQAMGYPLIPMLSGVAEMVLRVGAIVTLSSVIGFIATAYAETAAWSGALLMNMITFFVVLIKEEKKNQIGG